MVQVPSKALNFSPGIGITIAATANVNWQPIFLSSANLFFFNSFGFCYIPILD